MNNITFLITKTYSDQALFWHLNYFFGQYNIERQKKLELIV